MARIWAPDNYLHTFNAPRAPQRHQFVRGRYLPTQRITRALEGLAVPTGGAYDALHTINRIPITARPWISTFESAIPRTFGRGGTQVRRVLRERILRDNCGGLIAMSDYARRRMIRDNQGWSGLNAALTKTQVIHPNLPLTRTEPKRLTGDGLHLLFAGRDWARKGGVVALRAMREAERRGLPLRLTMVSSMDQASYAQHPDATLYAADRALLTLPNVTHHASLPNAEVLRLMAEADFTLLPTTHDTYGFSVLEGMAAGTPAIVTSTGALPEVVQDGASGIVLPVPQDDVGDYLHAREVSDWARWDAFYDDLAKQMLTRLEGVLSDPDRYTRMSAGSIARIQAHHEAAQIGAQLEGIYDRLT
ncbi:glycosyltransferase family 4 protein [Deinococcus daejeonensis]|uniref:Glycosyl transferase group 1 n=1 Tax=Deinococcus daejeonensis TaxID=1007098 RepID=A0ABQ2JB98_9DEIO|nr:glycosyltransferase family 4 protein [Deinococcus daejeonensis]GGN44077.1 hypothetical protein GCM10010842_32200 [Deinococcus daejeonensis]